MTEEDKLIVKNWYYDQDYSVFNYAIKENGWLDQYCNQIESLCYKVVKNTNLVGIFLFIPERMNEFRILINPDFLHMGYGTRIMDKAMTFGLKILKFDTISLIVRTEHIIAINLYKKFGFSVKSELTEIINGEKIHFLKMEKGSIK